MNRNAEFEALLLELEPTPQALEGTVERAMARDARTHRKRRFLGIPVASVAACFATFVMMVNVFPTFAHACGSIPILKELAKAVAWSPSLSAAVENEYVQPMGKTQTVNGITATIEYLIVDQKQVNIFFTLKGKGYDGFTGEMPELSPEQQCGRSVNNFREPPGTLMRYTLDYGSADVPSGFNLTFDVTGYNEPDDAANRPPEMQVDPDADMFVHHPREEEDAVLATFSFDLEFDPYLTAKGETIPVNTSFELDGQTLTVTEVEVYPTHARVEIRGEGENTAWLKGVKFYLENEDGEQFKPISNGVSAQGDPDSPAMLTFHLESPYFADSDHLTLHITRVKWLKKDMDRVRLDLTTGFMDRHMEGVTLISAEKRSEGWLMKFKVKMWEENHMYSIFNGAFYDAQGNEYHINASSSGLLEEGYFEETLPLGDYYEDVVWLTPGFSHFTQCDPIITVPIK